MKRPLKAIYSKQPQSPSHHTTRDYRVQVGGSRVLGRTLEINLVDFADRVALIGADSWRGVSE